MRRIRNGQILLVVALGVSAFAWGQGGRGGRGAVAQQPGAPGNSAGRSATGSGGVPTPGATGTGDFYAFDTTANVGFPLPDSQPAETHQKISLNGETLSYTARAGYLPLRNATNGQSEAHIFYTSYAQEGATDSSTRPLLFFFGGAPGVAATWQEFGGLGPKRMKWSSEGAPAPPYGWVENPHTLLGQADLVFVNPVGTAFSRPDQPSRGANFWNTTGDIASLAEFVRSFLVSNDRRNSPLFLAGEDFGTGRVAGLAAYLNEHHIPVQGVVLLSMALSADAVAGDTQYITLLPSLIMAAWHHKKLAPELNAMSAEQISGQARQFASRQYLHALYKGDRMTADERAKVIADLSRMTGLSKQFIVSNNLRITLDRFNSELMRDQHRGLSNSDARVTGFVPAPAGGGRGGRGAFGVAPPPPIDFNLSGLSGALQAGYEAYLRGELSSNGNGVFYLSSGGVPSFTATGSDDASLAGAFARSPNLRLFLAVNYYDLSAPFYATEYTLAHLNVSPEVRANNITISHYEAGQMTYADSKALAKLHGDLARFVADAAGPVRK